MTICLILFDLPEKKNVIVFFCCSGSQRVWVSFFEFIRQKTAILYLREGGPVISLTEAQKTGLEGTDRSEWKGRGSEGRL